MKLFLVVSTTFAFLAQQVYAPLPTSRQNTWIFRPGTLQMYMSVDLHRGDGVELPPGDPCSFTTGSCDYGTNTYPSLTWNEAKSYAESIIVNGEAAHLATMQTQEENTFIKDIVLLGSTEPYLAGGSDLATEGAWVWVDGGNVPLPTDAGWQGDWIDVEPNGGVGENCLLVNQNQPAWYDRNCDTDTFRFLLLEVDLTSTATASPTSSPSSCPTPEPAPAPIPRDYLSVLKYLRRTHRGPP